MFVYPLRSGTPNRFPAPPTSLALPSFGSAGALTSTNTTSTILAVPANPNFMLAIIASWGDGGNPVTPPAGWTTIAGISSAAALSNCGLYIRQAGGAEPATYTWTNAGGAILAVGQILSYNNVHGVLFGGANNTNGLVIPSIPIIIANGVNALILECLGLGSGATLATVSVNNNNPAQRVNAKPANGGVAVFEYSKAGPQNLTTTPDVFTAGTNWSGASLALV